MSMGLNRHPQLPAWRASREAPKLWARWIFRRSLPELALSHLACLWISFELVVEAGEPKMDQGGECAERGAHGSTFNRLC
jgi:hypothetical protein